VAVKTAPEGERGEKSPFREFAHSIGSKARAPLLDAKCWRIVGNGPIGAKAEELRRKAEAIAGAGFATVPRTVFATGFFDAFRQRNGIDGMLRRGARPEEIREKILTAEFSPAETREIARAVKRFGDAPLAVRSSAEGDCRGTGAYASEFCSAKGERGVSRVAYNIRKVLSSEFSENAIAFRDSTGAPGGMAVMVEPVFGAQIEKEFARQMPFFGPLYGGTAYTSTSSGGAVASVCGGLPTQAVKGRGVKLLKANEKNSLQGLKEDFLKGLNHLDEGFARKYRALAHGDFVELECGCLYGDIQVPISAVDEHSLEWLFSGLEKLEELAGKPQYVEWAVRERNGKPEAAILQIAEMTPKTDSFEFAKRENTLLSDVFEVVGTGSVECGGVAYIRSIEGLDALAEFNRTHSGYALMYDSTLVFSASDERLEYACASNAAAFIEVSEFLHADALTSHWGGLVDTTKKPMLVADPLGIDWEVLQNRLSGRRAGGALHLFDARVRVTASEHRQKAVVEFLD
jgi:hypothetical protein